MSLATRTKPKGEIEENKKKLKSKDTYKTRYLKLKLQQTIKKAT
jgi:hypothetical protein